MARSTIYSNDSSKNPNATSVVFIGSGPVAAESLELLSNDFNIEAIITKPKPENHRESFPVIDTGNKLKLPIKTVSNKIELSQLISSKPFNSKLAILIDFGIIVNKDVIDYFPLGIVNSHFSLLPQWRGADPITFAILSGQTKSGVSLMLINEGMDTGKLLAQEECNISPEDTTPILTKRMIKISYEMLIKYLPSYLDGSLTPYDQINSKNATYSKKLTKSDGIIDWQKPAAVIEREIRAYSGWPKSRTQIGGKDVIISRASVVPGITPESKPGKILINKEDGSIDVATGNDCLRIERLTPAGKREMTGREFLSGYWQILT